MNRVVVGSAAAVHLGAMLRASIRFVLAASIVCAAAISAPGAAAQETTIPHLHWRTLDTRYFRFFFTADAAVDARRRLAHRRGPRRGDGARRQRAIEARDGDRRGSEQRVERLRAAAPRSSAHLPLANAARSGVVAGKWIVERSALDSRVCAHRAPHAGIAQSRSSPARAPPAREVRPRGAARTTLGERRLRHVRRGAGGPRHRTAARSGALCGAATVGDRRPAADVRRARRLRAIRGRRHGLLAGSAFLEWLAARNGDSSVVHSGGA